MDEHVRRPITLALGRARQPPMAVLGCRPVRDVCRNVGERKEECAVMMLLYDKMQEKRDGRDMGARAEGE